MPYIIVVNQPGCLPEAEPYAVASLEDARESGRFEIERSYVNALDVTDEEFEQAATFARDLDFLTEEGGVIGPLPDGYVIDVQHVGWIDFGRMVRERFGYQGGGHLDIEAFNGAVSTPES